MVEDSAIDPRNRKDAWINNSIQKSAIKTLILNETKMNDDRTFGRSNRKRIEDSKLKKTEEKPKRFKFSHLRVTIDQEEQLFELLNLSSDQQHFEEVKRNQDGSLGECIYGSNMKARSDRRGLTCEICGIRSRSYMDLINHIQKHEDETPYRCNICKKAFAFERNFTSHMKRHIEILPFLCHICPKGFTDKSSHAKHIEMHMDNKDFHGAYNVRISQSRMVEADITSTENTLSL